MDQKLTNSQISALNHLKTGGNFFISGDAGTGKTYIIKYYVDNYCLNKNVLKCAYTALAADQMDEGRTLHSALNIPQYPTVKDKEWSSGQELAGYDVIIVDEISMVRIDYFEGLIRTIIRANKKREIFGRKPIQLILCGDFYQLPPIATDAEKHVIGEIYGKDQDGNPLIYPFESELWNTMEIHHLHLTDVVRQKDNNFIKILNSIKTTTNVAEAINEIKELSSKKPFSKENSISLFASNKKVNECNLNNLNNIDGELFIFEAEFNNELKQAIKENKIKDKDIPVIPKIFLKNKARVIFTMNDPYKKSKKRMYHNGSFGTIIDIDDKNISVLIDENNEIVTIPVEKYIPLEDRKFASLLYDDPICKDHKTVIQNPIPKIAYQIPIKLAYAITIHKSQGQTYDYVNFDPIEDDFLLNDGQLYVLLSRLTDIKGLYLMNDISPSQCKTSIKVTRFYKKIKGL